MPALHDASPLHHCCPPRHHRHHQHTRHRPPPPSLPPPPPPPCHTRRPQPTPAHSFPTEAQRRCGGGERRRSQNRGGHPSGERGGGWGRGCGGGLALDRRQNRPAALRAVSSGLGTDTRRRCQPHAAWRLRGCKRCYLLYDAGPSSLLLLGRGRGVPCIQYSLGVHSISTFL